METTQNKANTGTVQAPLASTENVESVKYASVVYRYAASLLDGLIIVMLTAPIAIFIIFAGSKKDNLLLNIIYLVVSYGYFVYQLRVHKSSIGKRFFNLRVETIDDKEITWGKAIIREVIGKFLSSIILNIGYLWAIFDKKKQGWHDKIAKTVVVQTQDLSRARKFVAYLLTFGLVILAILGILAVIVLVAINPAAQLEKAREAQKKSEELRLRNEQMYEQQLTPTVTLPSNSY